MNLHKSKFWKVIGLFMLIAGVIAYKELPDYWYMLMWIPIMIGSALQYGYEEN